MRLNHGLKIAIAALVLAISLPAAAQINTRAAPTNDNLLQVALIFAPYSASLGNVGEATTQVGEPEHSCIVTTSSISVWYGVNVPAGATLVVDTTASDYDTVISVYSAVYPFDFDQLSAVDCENDGNFPAKLEYPATTGGEYFVQISNTGLATGITLNVDFSFKIPASKKPKGQSLDKPLHLVLNGTTKLSNLEFGMNSFDGVDAPSCIPSATEYNSWFSLNVLYPMFVSISSEGSILNYDGVMYGTTVVTVYPEGNVTAASELDCAGGNGLGQSGVLDLVGLPTGSYIVRVSTLATQNMDGPSRYKVRVRSLQILGMLKNGLFGSADPLDNWTVKHATGDGITTDPGEIISAPASFKFVGGPNEKSQLQQTVVPPSPLLVDDDLLFSFQFSGNANVNAEPFTMSVSFTYSDGSVQTVKQKRTTVAGLTSYAIQLTPPGKKALVKAKVSVKYSAPTAVMIVDNFGLYMTAISPRGVLPPP